MDKEIDRLKIGIREWAIEEARQIWDGKCVDTIIVMASLIEKHILEGWTPELGEKD